MLIPIDCENDSIRVHGYVVSPTVNRGNNKMQYLFLNGRHIRDRSLQHALGEAYRGLLLSGRYPITFLQIDLPADAVDVNVHPTKLEVRFQDGGQIYSALLSGIRNKFLTTDLTAKVQPEQTDDPSSAAAVDPSTIDAQRAALTEWVQGALPQPSNDAPNSATATPTELMTRATMSGLPGGTVPAFQPFPSAGGSLSQLAAQNRSQLDNPQPGNPQPGNAHTGNSQIGDHTNAPFPPSDSSTRFDASHREVQSNPQGGPANHHSGSVPAPHAPSNGMQVHNRYLITENDDGVVIIDQHALHERVLYEQIREKVLAGAVESQQLLVPEPVTLSPTEAATIVEATEMLGKLGIEIEPFGGDTVLISSYPAMLANINPAEVLRQVLDKLMAGGQTVEHRDLLDDLLHMIACKAAIKAGDRLAPEEITALLEQRHLFHDTHHCPHGRPTALVFTREELDKRFLRT